MSAADAVKNDVHTVTREALNFFDEVLMPVVNWHSPQIGNRRRSAWRTGSVHLQPGKAPELQ